MNKVLLWVLFSVLVCGCGAVPTTTGVQIARLSEIKGATKIIACEPYFGWSHQELIKHCGNPVRVVSLFGEAESYCLLYNNIRRPFLSESRSSPCVAICFKKKSWEIKGPFRVDSVMGLEYCDKKRGENHE